MSATSSVDTGFAIRLYDALAAARAGQDMFLSPLSIQIALAMVAVGARGETRHALAELIGAPPEVEEQNRRFAAWMHTIQTDTAGHVALVMANALWGQQGVRFDAGYRQAIADCYGGSLSEVNFQSAAGQAVDTINAWAASQTNGKIPALVARTLVGPDTRLILTNAIYFKGTWQRQFDPSDTMDEDWYGPRGVRKVPMMQQRGGFHYCEAADYQALELPYRGEELTMLIVLPRQTDGLTALEKTGAAASTYRQATKALRHAPTVIASLPRFTMATDFLLKPILSGLGAERVFSAGADFSGLSDAPLQLAEVVHKAFIEVNEEGTEAAGATAVVMMKGGGSKPTVFLADHPFLFFIRHRKTNAVLFCGRVVEPMPA